MNNDTQITLAEFIININTQIDTNGRIRIEFIPDELVEWAEAVNHHLGD